jgi:hypothetical protein
MRKSRSCRQHKQAGHPNTVSSRASSDIQTCRELLDAEFQEKSYQQSQSVSQFLRGPTALTTPR